MLPDEPDASQLVDGQHADGAVLEVDDAVNPLLAIGAEHLVLAQG